MTRLHILRVANIADNRTGGMSRTMYGTGDEFTRRGHRVDDVFAPAFRAFGPRRLERYTSAWEAARLVMERLRHGKAPDVVEMHEPLAPVYAWRRRRDRRLPPLVAFSYGLEERGHRAMLAYRRARGIRTSPVTRAASWLLARQAAYAVRHADLVVCSNEADVGHLVGSGVPAARVVRHFSGVEPAFLEAEPGVARANARRLLFVGTWLERKGVVDLADAVSRVFRTHRDATLTVAGTVAETAEVRSAFAGDVRDRIHVIPRLEGTAELVPLYQAHGIFVLPSYFEGQPLSLIEAAALGLAPVVTDIGGSRDFVEDGVNGLVVPVANPSALADRLTRLLDCASLVERLGTAARRRARTHTWSAAADQLLRAYGALVEETNGVPSGRAQRT